MSKSKLHKTKIESDPVYQSALVILLMLRMLKSGKKVTAQRIVYKSLKILQERTNSNPVIVLEAAVKNVAPKIKVKTRRVGSAIHQFPHEIRASRGIRVGLKWIADSARDRPGTSIELKLAEEILDAAKYRGAAFRKKILLQKKVRFDRRFSRYRY